MLDRIREAIKPKYKPLNRIEIVKKNIIDNFSYLRSLQPQAEIWPVLKSNAYGHGLKEIAKILNKTKAKMVAVDSFPELQIVYKKFKGKVLLLNEMPLRAYKYCNFKRTEFCIYNEKTLRHLASLEQKAKIHLFINSGMNREGIKDLASFLKNNEKYFEDLEVVGFCSHLASADNDLESIKRQETIFWEKLSLLKDFGLNPTKIHLGNSAGIFFFKNQNLTAFRSGLALYGYSPISSNHPNYKKTKNLKPALDLYSTVTGIQEIKKGEKVSYQETFTAAADGRIAIIPFGYYEGLDINWGPKLKFRVNNKNKSYFAPLAGRISMNMSCLDCDNQPISLGDEVELISHIHQENSLEKIASRTNTLNYQILVKIQGNINRKII